METTEIKEDNETEVKDEDDGQNEFSLTRPSLGSDADYDDDLEVPDSIKIVDMGDGPVAIQNSEDEAEGKQSSYLLLEQLFCINLSPMYLLLFCITCMQQFRLFVRKIFKFSFLKFSF